MANVTEQTMEGPIYPTLEGSKGSMRNTSLHAPSDETSSISIKPISVVAVLGALTVVMILISTGVQYAYISTGRSSRELERIGKALSVDLELNVPTFFSMLLFLIASLLLAYISAYLFRNKGRYRWHWAILSSGFLFMAFDEVVAAHEKTVEPLRALLGGENLGIFYFAWVVPAIGLVLVLAIIFIRFWLNLPRRTRWLFLVGAALFLSGAIGMELIDGRYAEMYGKTDMTYMLLTTLEEGLEMAGIVIFIGGLLNHIADNLGGIKVWMPTGTR